MPSRIDGEYERAQQPSFIIQYSDNPHQSPKSIQGCSLVSYPHGALKLRLRSGIGFPNNLLIRVQPHFIYVVFFPEDTSESYVFGQLIEPALLLGVDLHVRIPFNYRNS
jgi:hypothetical protein